MKNKCICSALSVCLCASLLCSCGSSRESVALNAFPLDNVTLTESWVVDRENLNTVYLRSLDPERLLHNFRVNAGIESSAKPLDGWEAPWIGLRGHFTGHYLSAVSMLVGRNNDKQLAERLAYMVDELEHCQTALGDKGYLSAFPESDFDHVEKYFTGVWAPYYTYNKIMQGLLHAYIYTGNQKAYDMAVRMANYVYGRMERLSPESRKRMLMMVEANPQNEVGAMNEVLYALYGESKDPRHLELAQMFEPEWMMKSMLKGEDVLSGLHANTHIVIVNGYTKAYEVSGNADYRVAVENFWDMLTANHAYANGSSSGPRPNRTTPTSLTAEHWGLPGQLAATLTGEIAESCVSHNTQKLSSALFAWTADAKYADAYMNTFYNSVMALQSAHTGRCTYHLPLGSPRRKQWLTENDFRCCNGSSIEAFASLNNSIYFHDSSSLWVNMYVPSAVEWDGGVSLTQTGNFPFSPKMTLTVDKAADGATDVNLFIPSWADGAKVTVNGKDAGTTKPMSHKRLHREWKPGDRIVVDFKYAFHAKPMPDAPNMIALFYGPFMLAFEGDREVVLNGAAEDIVGSLATADAECRSFTLDNAGRSFRLLPLMLVENESYSVYATLSPHLFANEPSLISK